MSPQLFGTTLAALLIIATSSQAGAPQKGGSKGDAECRTHQHHCKHKLCEHCDAPNAPILGSAPAMMAPVILTRAEARRFPQEKPDEKQDELEQLRKLLELLDDLTPAATRESASEAPADTSAATSHPLSTRLDNLETSLQESVANMETAVDALVKMKGQLDAINERLKKIEGR